MIHIFAVAGANATILVSVDLFDHGPPAQCCLQPGCAGVINANHTAGPPRWSRAWQRNASIFASTDNGSTFQFRSWASHHYWSTLFTVGDAVYLFGVTDDKDGKVIISRSDDAGHSWTQSPPLFADVRYMTGPTAVLQARGMVYRAYEAELPGEKHAAVMLWANRSADLLEPNSWQRSNFVLFDKSFLPVNWGTKLTIPSQPWVEGNAVEIDDGRIFDILRLEYGWDSAKPKANYAIALELQNGTLTFTRTFELPGGSCKFTLRSLQQSNGVSAFVALTNNVTHPDTCPSARNVLTLVTSEKLLSAWTIQSTLLMDDQGLSEMDSMRYTSFSYVDWIFDGNDILAAIRTAYRGAVSYHNTNHITFKRFRGVTTTYSDTYKSKKKCH